MVVFTFFISDKDGKKRFFEESFLLADIKPEIVYGMLFLTRSNADIDFQARNLQERYYIIGDVFSTTRQVELIGKKKFAAAALDPEYKVFVINKTALTVDSDDEMAFIKGPDSLFKCE